MNFEAFKAKYQKVPVVHYPHSVGGGPMVSVCVQTYQHASFIRECLDGILMQQTDFPFEILLGEDESNDGTREICIEYAKKYPDKIRLFLHSRANNIAINGKPTGRFNFVNNLFSANGKYIALCEGDDYWIDPLKLQKQVDFLEANPEFSICFHWVKILWENEKILKESFYEGPSTFSLKEYVEKKKYNIRTSTLSICYKALSLQQMRLYKSGVMDLPNGDYTLCALVLTAGKAYVMPEYMGVYRRHAGGASNNFQSDSWVKSRLGTFKMLLRSKQLDLNTKYFLVKRIYEIYSWSNIYVRYFTKFLHLFRVKRLRRS